MATSLSSQTTTALNTALAASPGSTTEIVNVLNGAQLNNVTIPGTLLVTGLSTFGGGTANGAVQNTLTALASGGQAGATALKIGQNRVTVVASLHDSTVLPAATAGASVVAYNLGASAMDVYPVGASDVIQGLAAQVSMLVAAGSSIEFRCAVAGTWQVFSSVLLGSSWSTGTTITTFIAGQLTGAAEVTYTSTATTPGSIATRTATQMINDMPNAQVGMTYFVTVINLSGSANTMTITAGSGVTLTGTATIAQNIGRTYQVTFNTGTTLTMQEMYSFTAAA